MTQTALSDWGPVDVGKHSNPAPFQGKSTSKQKVMAITSAGFPGSRPQGQPWAPQKKVGLVPPKLRMEMMADQRVEVEAQIALLNDMLDYIDHKQALYTDMLDGKIPCLTLTARSQATA